MNERLHSLDIIQHFIAIQMWRARSKDLSRKRGSCLLHVAHPTTMILNWNDGENAWQYPKSSLVVFVAVVVRLNQVIRMIMHVFHCKAKVNITHLMFVLFARVCVCVCLCLDVVCLSAFDREKKIQSFKHLSICSFAILCVCFNQIHYVSTYGTESGAKKGAKRSVFIRAFLFVFENDEKIKMRETQHKKLIRNTHNASKLIEQGMKLK